MSDPVPHHPDPTHAPVPGAHAPHDTGHSPSFQTYMYVFYALCVLTALSFVSNYFVAGKMQAHQASMWIILAVAVVKATLVAMIFMHLKFDWPKLYCIVIPVCIMAVMMMIVLLPDIVFGWKPYIMTK